MTRNVNNHIREYKELFGTRTDNTGAFFASDYQQLMDLAKNDTFKLLTAACDFAFMVGYKAGKRGLSDNEKRQLELRQELAAYRLAFFDLETQLEKLGIDPEIAPEIREMIA